MKIYLAIKYHANHANRDRIESILAVLEQMGNQTCCVIRDLEKWGTVTYAPDVLMAKSFDLIAACDIVVVDLTEKGVGVGIEAGYACARDIPVITIAQTGAPISETLRGISSLVITYDYFYELIRPMFAFLREWQKASNPLENHNEPEPESVE